MLNSNIAYGSFIVKHRRSHIFPHGISRMGCLCIVAGDCYSAIVATALSARKRLPVAGSCSMGRVTQIKDLDTSAIVHIAFILRTKKLSIMTPKTERGFCYEKAFQ